MRDRVKHLHRFLKIEDRKIKIDNDRQLTLSPGFWDDNTRATGILKEIKITVLAGVSTCVKDYYICFPKTYLAVGIKLQDSIY